MVKSSLYIRSENFIWLDETLKKKKEGKFIDAYEQKPVTDSKVYSLRFNIEISMISSYKISISICK